ncbi:MULTISPECIES: penicillin-binding protein 2 [Rufibacter]|uniref:Penicillin-binding protein 2 n=1 Tax=Rufibacter quisquiliarum TaxID=1549639 RepID=A0A839GGV3_9BACT|nr:MULTISPECIES: penicillin-binding protein 2 [Rufibacter]MBA9078122.1 penicillin-binding protein 2 [Rufibacter quisquiliarum]
MKYLEGRKYVIQAIFIAIGAVYLIKLFFIQVLDDSYKTAADNNAMRRVVQYPFRGLIYDRDGKLLVENTPVYDLMVVPKEAKAIDTLKFCQLVGLTLPEYREKIKAARTYSYVKPSPFLQRLTNAEFAAIQDNLVDFPGFYINARTVRGYPHQSLAHALGYIGEISPRQLEDSAYKGYRQGDYLGVSGIERQYEQYLMGQRGVKYTMVNVRGLEKGSFKDGAYDTLSVAGQNLITTIDLELQKYGEKLMQGKTGSIVAIEPKTGEILSLISAPYYDPSLLTGKELGNNYMKLLKDPVKPLFNRPLMATYPPGSIFKLAQALIAMQEGTLTPNTGYACNWSLVKCSHRHPHPSNLGIAIEQSCNPYFYQVFRSVVNKGRSANVFQDSHLGLDAWNKHIKSFGFASKLGIDLPNEKKGLMPNSQFYDKIYGPKGWKFPTIYSVSIGQGETGVTPLQMANFAATIANRGYYYTPHIVRSVGEKGKPLPAYSEKHYTSVDPRHFPAVVEGMQRVVESGTARYARLNHIGVVICGKTGTVQNPHGKDHSVFIAFAPKDDPKIAIAVYVENAGGGAIAAAPMASLMVEKYLNDSITTPARKRWEHDMVSGAFYKWGH